MTKRIILKGIVQGVGMRFFCRQTARRIGIRGFVRNVSNGSVEIIAQGDENALLRFVNQIKSSGPGQVDSIQVDTLDLDTHYSKFGVKF